MRCLCGDEPPVSGLSYRTRSDADADLMFAFYLESGHRCGGQMAAFSGDPWLCLCGNVRKLSGRLAAGLRGCHDAAHLFGHMIHSHPNATNRPQFLILKIINQLSFAHYRNFALFIFPDEQIVREWFINCVSGCRFVCHCVSAHLLTAQANRFPLSDTQCLLMQKK